MLRVAARDRFGDKKLSLLKFSILDCILKAFMKGFADNNICRDTIRGLRTAGRSLQGICNIVLEAKQICQKLSELLDKDLHSKDLQLYKDRIHRNMDHNKIKALCLSCKTNTPSPKWGHLQSPLTRASSVPLLKQATYNPPVQGPGYGLSSFENKRLPYWPALLSINLLSKNLLTDQLQKISTSTENWYRDWAMVHYARSAVRRVMLWKIILDLIYVGRYYQHGSSRIYEILSLEI